MATASFGFEPFSIEIDLVEFAKLLNDITSIKIDNNTKGIIKEAIADIYTSYENIVNTVIPFLKIRDNDFFKVNFRNEYLKFVNIKLLTYPHNIATCNSVYAIIKKLSEDKGWKTKLPGAQKKLDQLEKLANRWLFNDNKVYDELKRFHQQLYEKLSEMYFNLDKKLTSESYQELQLFLKQYIPQFDELEPHMLEIVKISARL